MGDEEKNRNPRHTYIRIVDCCIENLFVIVDWTLVALYFSQIACRIETFGILVGSELLVLIKVTPVMLD